MNRNTITVLISSAGRRVGLIECFRSDAKALGLDLRVIAVDSNPGMSSGCQAADACYQAPRCTLPEFIPVLTDICAKYNVGMVVPTIDTELQVLSDHQEEFCAIGTRIVVSAPAVVRMARDKAETARFLSHHDIPSPRTGMLHELLTHPDSWRWPVILKPINGSSSMGICTAEKLEQVENFAKTKENYVVQELWTGREYTVNVFFDRNGNLRSAIPHLRCEIRAGEVSKGITDREPLLMDVADRMGAALKGAYGPLCFQAIITEENKVGIFEINARFGGGYPLAHRAGATFTRWLLEEMAGLPSTANDDWRTGVLMLRYDAAVFKDFEPVI